jgi:hypothetical protein
VGPELRCLLVGDDPARWAEAGFVVDDGEVGIGRIRVRLTGDEGPRGLHGWALAGIDSGSIDGLATFGSDLGPTEPARHANRVTRVDHVVAMTPDLDRTVGALARFGFEPRRRREVPGSDPPRAQVFFWAGDAILELVGPVEPRGSGPAAFWGLALTCDDLDAAAEVLGERLGPVTDAVQRGRRIATLRTRDLDISVPIALMSPHTSTDTTRGAP